MTVDSEKIKTKVKDAAEKELSAFFKKIDACYYITPPKYLTPPHQAWLTLEYMVKKEEEEVFAVRISFNSRPTQYSTFLQEYAGITLASKRDLEHFCFSKNFSFNPLDVNLFSGYKDNFKDDKSILDYIDRLGIKLKQGIKAVYTQYLKSIKSSQLLSSILNEIINSQWGNSAQPLQVTNKESNSYVKMQICSKVYNTSLYEAQDHCYLLTVSESDSDTHCLVYRFIRYTPIISVFWNFKTALNIGVKLLKNKYYYKKSPFVREISKELECFISDAISP